RQNIDLRLRELPLGRHFEILVIHRLQQDALFRMVETNHGTTVTAFQDRLPAGQAQAALYFWLATMAREAVGLEDGLNVALKELVVFTGGEGRLERYCILGALGPRRDQAEEARGQHYNGHPCEELSHHRAFAIPEGIV